VRVKGIGLDGGYLSDVLLGHSDAFAAGDLALQEAAKLIFKLEARPKAAELQVLAERWRPWRALRRACSLPITPR